MSRFLACTNCHEVVVKGLGSEIKVRAKVLIVRGNHTYAVCKGCGTEIEVPLRFDEHTAKSFSNSEPRLYLKK